ncbi:MAG TPA: hypothetical protein VHI52_02815 [Verrucomicrobiae bacterium]|nr:hypothetical protein [Verrucomicrobiae bacterium]
MADPMIGTTLTFYRITAKLGEGGMGEVYSAADTRLGREVAIKVLPASFSRNHQSLVRFEHEAKAPAAPNHPHPNPKELRYVLSASRTAILPSIP